MVVFTDKIPSQKAQKITPHNKIMFKRKDFHAGEGRPIFSADGVQLAAERRHAQAISGAASSNVGVVDGNNNGIMMVY